MYRLLQYQCEAAGVLCIPLVLQGYIRCAGSVIHMRLGIQITIAANRLRGEILHIYSARILRILNSADGV
jgi:hypothetical protein